MLQRKLSSFSHFYPESSKSVSHSYFFYKNPFKKILYYNTSACSTYTNEIVSVWVFGRNGKSNFGYFCIYKIWQFWSILCQMFSSSIKLLFLFWFSVSAETESFFPFWYRFWSKRKLAFPASFGFGRNEKKPFGCTLST